MAKICSTCQADNRDEAQFCRACGTPFAAAAPVHDAGPSAGITCADCGFVNRPGVRYCAKCGVNLMGTVVVPRSKLQVPAPPPVPAYSAPAYSAPAHAQSDYPPPFDSMPAPDVPDARFALDFEREQASEAPPVAFGTAPVPPAPNRTGLWVGLGVAVVVAAGVAWWFLNAAPPAPAVVTPPAATPAAVAPEPQPEPKAAEVVAAPAPTAPASGADALGSVPAPQATLPSAAPTPDAGVPKIGSDGASNLGEAETQRLAAEKKAREKAARDKLEREAKAKAAAEQREQAIARAKAEQDAARKRAEESQPRPQPNSPAAAPPVVAAPAPQSRTVKEICAGRNSISQAVCESRECGAPEHANEALCKQIRDAEERRRERQSQN